MSRTILFVEWEILSLLPISHCFHILSATLQRYIFARIWVCDVICYDIM